MLPLLCIECQKRHSNNPLINGIYHGRDHETKCPICGNIGKPASVVHLLLECPIEESHPEFRGSESSLGRSKPHKIACGFGPRLPKYLTSSPIAATCFHCLKVYRQMTEVPVSTESLE